MPASLRSLQIVRALAALSVVHFHVVYQRQDGGLVFGQFGVDIFFVLSGFVMAMVIAGGQAPREFAISRLIRIVPLYWIMTTGLLLLATLRPSLLNSTAADLAGYLKSLLFVPFFKDNGLLQPLLGVGWSLNYEMAFYAVLWVALLAAPRRPLLMSAGLLVLGFVLGRLSGPGVTGAFLGNGLVFEFILGLLAFRAYRAGVLARVPAPVLASVAGLALAGMAAIDAGSAGMDLRLVLFGPLATILVLALVQLEPALRRGGPLVEAASALGDSSYATYLAHIYVIELVRRVVVVRLGLQEHFSSLPGVVLVTCAALAVGHLLFLALDRPLHRALKQRLLGRRTGAAGPMAQGDPVAR